MKKKYGKHNNFKVYKQNKEKKRGDIILFSHYNLFNLFYNCHEYLLQTETPTPFIANDTVIVILA